MSLISVQAALDRILAEVVVVPSEGVNLADANGRVLAEPVVARRTQPSFDASAMDGYALRSADAGPGQRLRVVGESVAGKRFERPLGTGEAVRIFTGAPMPDGADTVLMQEDAKLDGTDLLPEGSIQPDRYVRPMGIDFRLGDELLPSGRRIGPRELALAASGGHDTLTVRRSPRVIVLSIGDELVPAGALPGPDQTVASNAEAILALAKNAGAETEDLGIVADEASEVTALARAASERCDIFVTIGGASVGDRDITRLALAEAGMALDFWRIAMRPGKPLVFGRLRQMLVLGLPGNPVSSFVCGLVFLRPLVRALLGMQATDDMEPARLGADLPANGERTSYLRARLIEAQDDLPRVVPLEDQDSSLQRVLAEADCLLVRPARADRSLSGAPCRIVRLGSL